MKKVLVKYRGSLTFLTGTQEETLEASTVGELLKSIRKNYGREAEKTARAMLIAVNGKSILLLKRYKTALEDGDLVNFFPLSGGG